MTTDTSEPAFAQCRYNMKGGYDITGGMTLRDYAAIKAMQGFISARAWHPDFIYPDDFAFVAGERAADEVAVSAYKYADALLKARKA